MARASWDQYFMDIATVVSSRSTCERKHVGAVIVRDRTILSTGYNGSIRGMPHCSEVGHMLEGGHCIATIHAEQNAIIHAAKNGVSINAAHLYVTASPCWSCFKSMTNAGILRIVYGEFYRDSRIFDVAARLGIELIYLAPNAALPDHLPDQSEDHLEDHLENSPGDSPGDSKTALKTGTSPDRKTEPSTLPNLVTGHTRDSGSNSQT